MAGNEPNQGTKMQKSRRQAPHPVERGEGAVKIQNNQIGPKVLAGGS